MAEKPRRSGRNAPKRMGNLTENDTDVTSSNVEMEDLTLDEKKNKKVRALKNLKAKTDENSKFMSNFDPSASRRVKARVSGKSYEAPPVPTKKSAIYDHRGVIIQVGGGIIIRNNQPVISTSSLEQICVTVLFLSVQAVISHVQGAGAASVGTSVG